MMISKTRESFSLRSRDCAGRVGRVLAVERFGCRAGEDLAEGKTVSCSAIDNQLAELANEGRGAYLCMFMRHCPDMGRVFWRSKQYNVSLE